MMTLSSLNNRLANLIEQRTELSQQLVDFRDCNEKIMYWDEKYNDNRKLFIKCKDEDGSIVSRDYSKEMKSLEGIILTAYKRQKSYKEYTVAQLNKVETEIDEVNCMIMNHWRNRLQRVLFTHGWSSRVSIG